MRKLLLVSLLLLSLKSIAQDNTGCFHVGGSESESPRAMVITYDGNYVMGGGTQSFVLDLYGNFYVFKTDPSGNVLWSTSLGNGLGDECLDLIETSDHSIVGIGHAANSQMMLAVKLDENGNLQWVKTIDILIGEEAYAVVETEDGGFLIAGDCDEPSSLLQISYLIKLDSDGNKVWEKLFRNLDNPFGNTSIPYVLVRTVENHYIVGCWFQSIDNFFGVVAFDKAGNYLWAKQSTTFGVPYGLVATADSGFVLAGYTFYNSEGQLCKFDKEGNLEWSKAYGDSLIDIFYSVEVTDDGGLIAAGAIKNDQFSPDNGYIVKTDSLGNLEWSRMLGDATHPSTFKEVHQAMDGGYVAAGEYYDNYFVAKFDADGNICDDCLPADYGSEAPGTGFTDVTMGFDPDTGVVEDLVYDQYTGGDLTVLCLNTGIEPINESLSLTVYPNPSPSGNFEIVLPAEISNAVIEVHDVTGKVLRMENLSGSSLINLSDHASGVYFLFMEHHNQRYATMLIK